MVGPSSKVSKILLALLLLILVFYFLMDVELYMRIQKYPIQRNYHFNSSSNDLFEGLKLYEISSSSSFNIVSEENLKYQLTEEVSRDNYEYSTWLPCNINPLCHVTVKAILLDHTNLYIFAPLATIFDDIIGFSRSKVITANLISFSHVAVAFAAGKLISSDSLGYRRLGVVLFQIRTFLDDLDGHVARVKKNIRGERSEVGTTGYYIDGICDALGCLALVAGMFFFLKNNPPRRGYTHLPMVETQMPEPMPKIKSTTKTVTKKVFTFSGILLLSSIAWNRYIAVFQDMIERTDISPDIFLRQNIVLKSSWFFCVSTIWRIINVHSILHAVLLSIFCDKLWEFLKMIQYSGYVIILISILISEIHVRETQYFIFN